MGARDVRRRVAGVAAIVGIGLAATGCVSVGRANVSGAGAQSTGPASGPAISADGRVVAFVSAAADLVAGDTNGVADVFVHDFGTGATERVSLMGDGAEKLFATTTFDLSPDGQQVAFEAIYGELDPGTFPPVAQRDWVGVHDRPSGTTGPAVGPTQRLFAVSAPQFLDGGELTVGRLESGPGSTEHFRPTPSGVCPEPALVSGDGRWCSLPAPTPGLRLVPAAGEGSAEVLLDTELTTDGAVPTATPADIALSSSGRFAAFASAATNHVAGDANGVADVFVVDRDADGDGTFDEGTSLPVERVGVAGNGASGAPALSSDGRYVVFVSAASNLVAGDTNGVADVFRYGRTTGATERVSVANGSGAEADGASSAPAVAAGGGGAVAFLSDATNLVGGDTNGATDVFRRLLDAGGTTTSAAAG